MTEGAKKLLLELYSKKDEDDRVFVNNYYADNQKRITFEKYAKQLERDGFIDSHWADDCMLLLFLTADGIEAAEDEPGSKFSELMNPLPDEIDIEQLEVIINSAIQKASKEDRVKLGRLLENMRKVSAGEKINIGNLIKDVLQISNGFISVVKAVTAFLSVGQI